MHVLGRIPVPVVRADIAVPGHTLQASAGEAVMSDERPDTLRPPEGRHLVIKCRIQERHFTKKSPTLARAGSP